MQLAIIIPYRDRSAHLQRFVPYMREYLSGIEHCIVVVQQTNEKHFNRGKLLNVGFDLARESDYFAFHDVDQLPHEIDYSYPSQPIHLATRMEHNGFNLPYEETMGGVALFNREHFLKIDGFDNEYWGWGWEDVDLYMRCKLAGLEVGRSFDGWYESMPHDRPQVFTPKKEYQPWVLHNSARFEALAKAYGFEYHGPYIHSEPVTKPEHSGLSNLSYRVLSEKDEEGYKLWTVEI